MRPQSLDDLEPCDSVYISPHGDDAALACWGRIFWERAQGLRVFAVSVFRSEDDGGMPLTARLGAGALTLAMAPAAERYPASLRSRLRERLIEDDEALPELVHVFHEVARRTRARHVHAPLGVGGDIDHRLCHEVARGRFERDAGRNVFFYEERPEALVPGAVRVRLASLGARLPPGAGDARDGSGLVRFVLRFRGAPHQCAVSPRWIDRMRCTRLAVRHWLELRAWNPRKAFGPRLQPSVHQVAPAAVEALRAAVAGAPRLAARLGSVARVEKQLAAYARRLGHRGLVERCWLLLPPRDEGGLTAVARIP